MKHLLAILLFLVSHTVCQVAETNPFQEGCLYAKLKEKGSEHRKRVCNSDDNDETHCEINTLKYPEYRIHNAMWESNVVLAWINQIVLMEMGMTPATVGLRTKTTSIASFYGPSGDTVYSDEVYPLDGLRTGNQNQFDCTSTDEPCVHILPEVWREPYELVIDNVIEPPYLNGLWGSADLYIPAWLAKKYPGLVSWRGLQGEENRELLAETFLRPTNWSYYCTYGSSNNCTKSDGVAERSPEEHEQGLYFSEGNFTGYFNRTKENNCTTNEACTGAVLGPPCDQTFHLDSMIFWNNISGLSIEGPLPNGGYNIEQLEQIWRAANATNAAVMMYWWQIDRLPVEFRDSDYAFERVRFPPPSRECFKNQPTEEERCSTNLTVRRGDKAGACDQGLVTLKRILVRKIGEDTSKENNEAKRSPAFNILSTFKMEMNDMREILYEGVRGADLRESVCDWVFRNREILERNLPPGYPRIVTTSTEYEAWYIILMRVFCILVFVVAFLSLFFAWRYRKAQAMFYAQPVFMYLIISGFCLYTFGGVMATFEPTVLSCNLNVWLIMLGSTIELVPVLVKTSAINRLIGSAKTQRRVNISRNSLLLQVATVVMVVCVYLITMTIVNPSSPTEEARMISDDTVYITIRCDFENRTWYIVYLIWLALLLLVAVILSFQTRGVMSQLNESTSLAMLVYCHAIFLIFRLCISYFWFQDSTNIRDDILESIRGTVNCLDALCAMSIYVFPKIVKSIKEPEDYQAKQIRQRVSSLRVNDEEENLQILVCTANMGNAEPTLESMKAWIPPHGLFSNVTQLDKSRPVPCDNFDLIVIGMQEATWKTHSNLTENDVEENEVVSVRDVLDAMDDQNTSQLRLMVKNILGDEYNQMVEEQRGQMRLSLWISDRVINRIHNIKIDGANCGIGNVLANKGGIMVSLNYKDTRISFLSAHLAAHEGESYYKTRCENIQTILREAKTLGISKFGLTSNLDNATISHHMFVLGDLNFRINFEGDDDHENNVKRALTMIEEKDFLGLYGYDELQAGLEKGDLLDGFQTLPCDFPPTFKVKRTFGFDYKAQRTPSYTDRILFKSFDGLTENLKPLAYEPCVDFITSDHKPIRGAFTITPNRTNDLEEFTLDGTYRLTLGKMKCSGLPAGDANGLSDPYLKFMWDSPNIIGEDVALQEKMRKLMKCRKYVWPKTHYISKTLDPDWGDAKMSFLVENCFVGQMLYIAVIDFDMISLNDCLAVVALNIHDLIQADELSQKVTKQLVWDGKAAGKIEFTVDASVVSRRRIGSNSKPNYYDLDVF